MTSTSISLKAIHDKGLPFVHGIEQVYDCEMTAVGGVLDDIVLTSAELVEAWAAHEREAARLALATRRLEVCGDWARDGSVSMAAWLRHHCRMSNRDANALVHRGRFLDKFSSIAEAACEGVLSAGHIAVLKASCPPPVEVVMGHQQGELVTIVAPLSVAETESVAHVWRQRAEALVELAEPIEPDRALSMATTADGVVGKFVLDKAGALQFQQAIRIASTWDGSSDGRSTQRRSADALVDVCAFFNANHTRPGTPRQRPHVELITQQDSLGTAPLGWTTDHTVADTDTTDAVLCDCVIHRVVRAGAAVLSYGRATRTVPIDLFRAVAVRDGGCRFPGCDRKIAWCDAHHVRHWRHLGLTELENLVLLCNRHHHLIHQTGWHLKLLPNADLEVTHPDGTTRTTQPRGHPARSP
jgi:hypothetical protein